MNKRIFVLTKTQSHGIFEAVERDVPSIFNSQIRAVDEKTYLSLLAQAESMAEALDSANKTLRYVQEVSAHGHGAHLISQTIENNERAWQQFKESL